MTYKYNERDLKVTEITGLGLIKDCHACLVLQDLCYLHQQYGEGKSCPLTSPIKGLKDGEVAEENVHFKVAYRKWLCGIKGERESEFMYSTKEFMDTYYPNDYESVAIPLTKEEPLLIEGEKRWGKLNREFDAALESATKEDFERVAKKVEGEKKKKNKTW